MPSRLHEPIVNSVSTPSGLINYRLMRSAKRRKTVHICIRQSSEVEVHAPVAYSCDRIEGFISSKSRWIIEKLNLFKLCESNKKSPGILESLYLGQAYPVILQDSETAWGRIHFDDKGWTVDVPRHKTPAQRGVYAAEFLLKWYKSRAKTILDQRVEYYGRILGVEPSQVRIRSPKRLWGSCHPSKRVLNFNWKIIMAPVEMLDYVVIHELSHIKVPDHSKRFWRFVSQFCPDFKKHNEWFKFNGHSLKLPLIH